MKIVVLSDLHINKCAKEKNPEWIEPFCNFLMQYAAEKLIVVVMGDIIESGHVEYYALADKLFSNIEKLIEKSQANFIFIPGNHDNCNGSFEPFVDFCRKHQTKQYPLCDYTEKSIFNISIDGVNLILANSNTEDHSKAGHLDLNQLSRCVDLDMSCFLKLCSGKF